MQSKTEEGDARCFSHSQWSALFLYFYHCPSRVQARWRQATHAQREEAVLRSPNGSAIYLQFYAFDAWILSYPAFYFHSAFISSLKSTESLPYKHCCRHFTDTRRNMMIIEMVEKAKVANRKATTLSFSACASMSVKAEGEHLLFFLFLYSLCCCCFFFERRSSFLARGEHKSLVARSTENLKTAFRLIHSFLWTSTKSSLLL